MEKARAALLSPRYAEVHGEYERMGATKKGRPKHWFSLWDGPAHTRDLARRLRMLSAYEPLYCHWSTSAHGEAAVSRVAGRGASGLSDVHAIRSPEGLASACQLAFVLCNDMTFFILRSLVASADDPISSRTRSRYEEMVRPHGEVLVRAVRENVIPIPRTPS